MAIKTEMEARQRFKLGKRARWRGLLVHIHESGEYLAAHNGAAYAWTERPAKGMLFKDYDAALSVVDHCGHDSAEVVHLIETAGHWFVYPSNPHPDMTFPSAG